MYPYFSKLSYHRPYRRIRSRIRATRPPLGTAPPPSSSSPGSSRRHSSSCPRPQVTFNSFRCRCISPSRTREISGCSRHGRCLREVDPPAPETASLAPSCAARHSPCTNPGPRRRPHPIHELEDNGAIPSLTTAANVSDLSPHIVPNDHNAAAAFPSPAPSAFLSLTTDSDRASPCVYCEIVRH
jgi:hypothetical protein